MIGNMEIVIIQRVNYFDLVINFCINLNYLTNFVHFHQLCRYFYFILKTHLVIILELGYLHSIYMRKYLKKNI
jgi:hypothetical protein